MKKYKVTLSGEERQSLEHLISRGKGAARKLLHARILLKADEAAGWSDEQISEALEVSLSTIGRVRERFVEEGLVAALERKAPKRVYQRRLDGVQEAHLVALVCSPPPEERGRWTLKLLAEKLVELGYVESVGRETVRQTLKKNELKPWLKQQWCLPTQADGAFVYHMEDVLEVYQRPYDPLHPTVCMDEMSKQLVGEITQPLPLEVGQPQRYDYEYVRNGVNNLFLFFEPLAGQRFIKVTDRRTKVDWAEAVRDLVDVYYPHAPRITLVMDNLNTHSLGALYEAFEPAEAKRIADRLKIHHTPKHGSWLNMAEMEFSVLARQCLDRRIPETALLKHYIATWQARRNLAQVKVDWRFTTADARIKLKRLYPSNHDG
ncbi:MAG TPA: IS630 family transposase [Candidatus Saccharimonadales bacterium]|nr:IS630 family transposase [Candidatus Saccharimonadales bacterium]